MKQFRSKKIQEQYERYEERLNQILEATSSSSAPAETATQSVERKKMLLDDYRAFAQYYFPHYCTAPSADFHVTLAIEVATAKDKCFLVKKWPRAHAKSVNACVIMPIWLMLRGQLRFMVLCGQSSDSATGLLTDLQAELAGNQLLEADYGQLYGTAWQMGDFTTTGGTRFKAIGRGQSPRGLRARQHRPDLVVVDDIDDDKLVRNPKLVRAAYDWVIGALLGTMDTGKTRFVAVGNMISKTSILNMLCTHPFAQVEQINLTDANGKPSWWQKNTPEDCEREIAKYDNFRLAQRELFHNPFVEGQIFKDEHFQYSATDWGKWDDLIGYTDPSFSAKGDYKATVVIARYGTRFHVLDVRLRKATIHAMVEWHYTLQDKIKRLAPGANLHFYMESSFAQYMLFDEFDKFAGERGHLNLSPDGRAKGDKFARIEAIANYFERGLITWDIELQNSTDFKELKEQFLAFGAGNRGHDDGPDAVEGALHKLNAKLKTQQNIAIIPITKNKYSY